MGSPRLECCVPTAYDGGSRTIVHSLACATPEATLSAEEYELYRSQLEHPARYEPTLSLVEPVVKARRRTSPKRTGYLWNVGGRDPRFFTKEDLS